MSRALGLSVAMFSLLPVPAGWVAPVERAGAALRWLPFVGAALGALAALPAVGVLARDHGAAALAAAVAVAALAALTRGLHLDGLADTADGLGSRAEPERALELMRRSDIGPFGVIALVLVLIVDVAALATVLAGGTWRVVAILAVAAATGRLAVVQAAVRGIDAARGGGFGALVAGSVRPVVAAGLTAVVLAAGAGLAWTAGANPLGWVLAQAVALAVGAALRWHLSRRLGGVTGDVFGALVEVTTAATLVGLALTVR